MHISKRKKKHCFRFIRILFVPHQNKKFNNPSITNITTTTTQEHQATTKREATAQERQIGHNTTQQHHTHKDSPHTKKTEKKRVPTHNETTPKHMQRVKKTEQWLLGKGKKNTPTIKKNHDFCFYSFTTNPGLTDIVFVVVFRRCRK